MKDKMKKNKLLQKIITYSYLAAVFIPAVLSITNVYTVQADEEIFNVTIQPDPSSIKDSWIRLSAPNSTGNTDELGVGEDDASVDLYRSFLEFDLTTLPANITVVGATLSLWVKEDHSSNDRDMHAYSVYKNWVETSVTWNRYYNGLSLEWQTPGATGATDASSVPIGTVNVVDDLAVDSQVDMVLDAEAMRQFIKQNYFGFKLQMDTESNDMYVFYSSDEATETDKRPQLYIEYTLGEIPPLTDWHCRESLSAWDCGPVGDGTLMMPFQVDTSIETTSFSLADGWHDNYTGGPVSANLDCDPYPLCKNDYPVYYKMSYQIDWVSSFGSVTYPQVRSYIDVPDGTDVDFENHACGFAGTSGSCSNVRYGVIDRSAIGTSNTRGTSVPFGGFDFAAKILFFASGVTPHSLAYDVEFSLSPITENCSAAYTVPEQFTYIIDPLIETPLGPAGEPPDDQIFPLVEDEIYMMRVSDGPWNDGTDDRYDASVSLDGSTWVTLEEFSTTALCVDTDPVNPELIIVYFTATSEQIYIRANDETGEFDDNVQGSEPFKYKIGLAYTLVEQVCESQFTYDDGDVFASIPLLNSLDDDGERAADEFTHYDIFQPGEWYAVTVDDGAWQDDGGDPTTAMQYVFTGDTASGGDWEALAEGSTLVQCVHTDGVTVFVQAIDTTLNLRADDGDDDFSNNTGTMSVKIYHAIRERPTETCEMRFAIDDLVRSDSVDGNQANGKVFALAVGTALVDSDEVDEFFLSGGLVPGAWYALETTGGPWGYLANYHYDMAIAQESAGSIGITPSGEWGPLADWDMADCNIQTDPLGHRLVYFQIPVSTASQWKLRVNGSSSWFLNGGSMGWNLYRVRDLGFTPDGICDYTYESEGLVTPSPQTVNAVEVNGASLLLSPSTFYAVEILGESYQWFEEDGGSAHIDMEVSLNNGQSWGDIPGSNVLCVQNSGDNVIFFIHTGVDPQVKLRVNSTSFENNVGLMGWNIYTADAGSSITGCTTTGYSISEIGNVVEWIPVQDEEGRMITSTSAVYAEISGLVSGNTYIIETSRGGWTDGESETQRYSAQVSSDGGATWHSMDGTNPDVNCWEVVSVSYRKIEVTAIDGQIWKIRVADTETETFVDNGGNLGYTIKGLVLPDDELVQGEFNLMGCNTPAVSPSLSEVDSFTGLANYLAGWFDYSVASVVNFFALCPQHIDSFSYFGIALEEREPFATMNAFESALNDIKNELNAYDWETAEDYSVLDKSPAESAMIQEYIFGPLPDDSPWVDGDLVDLSAVDTTDYYENCTWAAAEYVGPRLAGGVCFSSNWAKEVGFTFYIQLALDVAVMFACIKNVWDSLFSVLAMLTGVNLAKQR
jgi:hypothetical protein